MKRAISRAAVCGEVDSSSSFPVPWVAPVGSSDFAKPLCIHTSRYMCGCKYFH